MSAIRGFETSSNIVYSCKYPIVWCPKYRRKVLVEIIAIRLEEIIREVVSGGAPLEVIKQYIENQKRV